MSQSRRTRHAAFTVLELMIALGLLGALMLMAWSLLDSYRSTEQRGWDRAYRLQSVRAARLWLQRDASHVSVDDSSISFQGDDRRFQTEILASVDPLPWLEDLFHADLPVAEPSQGISRSPSARSRAPLGELRPLDPQTRYRVEYQLTFVALVGEDAVDELVRTMTPIDPWQEVVSGGANTESLSEKGSDPLRQGPKINEIDLPQKGQTPFRRGSEERVLSIRDLYRADDGLRGQEQSSTATQTSRLQGIAGGSFRYHDGRDWKTRWNAVDDGGLPQAIELVFNFPSPQASRLGAVIPEERPEAETDPLRSDEVPQTIERLQAVSEEREFDVRIVAAVLAAGRARGTQGRSFVPADERGAQ